MKLLVLMNRGHCTQDLFFKGHYFEDKEMKLTFPIHRTERERDKMGWSGGSVGRGLCPK